MQKLTPKQATFVREFLIDLNATQAAIRSGYSEKTAAPQAARLLTNVNVQAAIQEAQEARAERTEVSADRVLLELIRLGTSNVKQLFDNRGNLLDIHEIDDGTAAAISSIEVVMEKGQEGNETTVFTKKIRFWDKKGSLELIGKHLGMFEPKQQESTADKARAIVDAIRAIDDLDEPHS